MRKPLVFSIWIFVFLLTSCQKSPLPNPSPGFSSTPQAATSPALDPRAVETPGFVPIAREEAPLSLTTADGTGLKLVSVKAQAVLDGPLAFTQLHLVFDNPEDRVVEGRFEITMPDGAAISRFAMKIGDRWQEAEVVERQAAQRAYEDFLHRKQDPALLEKEAGNEFHARIFPIPAKGRKDILISYSQELESSTTPYVLPLAGLPKMDDLSIEVSSGGKPLPAVTEKDHQPKGDFAVPQDGAVTGLAGGDVVVARVRPAVSSLASRPEDLLVLFDTSASRGLGFTDQVELLADVLKELPSVKKLTVAAFDQNVEMVYEGEPASFSPEVLLKRKALGATDLQAALAWAAATKGHTRLLLVTDGITTAGEEKLGETLRGSSFQRLDVMMVGGIRDKDRMEVLVGEALAQEGAVLDSDLSPRELARKLGLSVNSGIDVSVKGARWVWPTTLDGVQPGDERLVYAEIPKPGKDVAISLGGAKAVQVPLQTASAAPLLTRSAAVARIARLESMRAETKDDKAKAKLAQEIVGLSTSQRVLSDLTALLVLETEYDYERFGIDRNALSDILEIGKNGLVLTERPDLPTWADDKPQRPSPDDGIVRQSHQIKREVLSSASATPGATPGGDYVHEVESANYLVAQNKTRTVDTPTYNEYDTTMGSMGRAAPEARGGRTASFSDNDGVRDGASPEGGSTGGIESGAEFSAYSSRPEDDGRMMAQERSRSYLPEPSQPTAARRPAPAPGGGASGALPLDGKMAEIDALLKSRKVDKALEMAWAWHQAEPGNVLPLLALGDCLEANGDTATAARVYGSIIDLFPSRADLRRFAGTRLQGLKEGLPLAVDTFTKAVKQRPDHVSSHRFLAFALARQKKFSEAFSALEAGRAQDYPGGRFAGWQRVLGEDLRLLGAAWGAREPAQKKAIAGRLAKFGLAPTDKPSLRFILTWETDANDVDFHIEDSKGGHAFYSSPNLASGGQLFADVTTGYGPECFAIEGTPQAYPYKLQIHYYARGPMGYGMGQLEVLQHDGKGNLLFEERPYVVMKDGAYVDLGTVAGQLKSAK